MAVPTRKLGGADVERIGLGCMNVSHAYGAPPPREDAVQLIRHAYELGVRHFDTAALYGFGRNEEVVGEALKPIRNEVFLASKCGLTGVNGKRVIDGRPETLRQTCDQSLKSLQTETIDLYTLHRLDKNVPIEDSVGALKDLVAAGKIRAIGLSEVSAETLRKAAGVHPIAALQTEYSLWTRNPEIAVLDACKQMGTAFVAFSPLARAFLSGHMPDPSTFDKNDIRTSMPRFQSPNFEANSKLLTRFIDLAKSNNVTPTQFALAWVLSRGDHVHIIPGTRSIKHLEENVSTETVNLPRSAFAEAEAIFSPEAISGPRYNAAAQASVGTEDF